MLFSSAMCRDARNYATASKLERWCNGRLWVC
jgi:hypothetical protein